MIYLIGGAPRTGKSTLAKLLAQKTGFNHVPTDFIAASASTMMPDEECAERYPLGHARKKTHRNNDLFYSKYSPTEIIDLYRKQAKSMWPAIKVFLEYADSDELNMIVEGYHIDPALVSDLDIDVSSRKIVFFTKKDSDELAAMLPTIQEPNDWTTTNTSEEATYGKIATMVTKYSKQIETEAQSSYPVLQTDNLEEATAQIIDTLLSLE